MKYIKKLSLLAVLTVILLLPNLRSSGANPKVPQPELVSAVSVNYKTNRINWTTVEDADGYGVYRKSGSYSWLKIAEIEGGSKTSYSDASSSKRAVKLGTTYSYTVAAYKNRTSSGTSSKIWGSRNPIGLKVTTLPEMADIKSLKVTVPTLTSMKLSWMSTSDATGYGIYRKTASGSWKWIANVIGKTTYTDTPITKGSAYYYSIRPYRISGGKKYRSNYDKAGVYAVSSLSQPSLVSVSSSAYNSVDLTWKPVSNATGYAVYRKEKGGSFTKIATVKGKDTLTYKDKTAVPGTLYSYSVRAYNNTGSATIWSSYSKTGLSIATRPSRVYLDAITSGSYHSATISWQLSKKASGYDILRKESGTSFTRIATVKDGSSAKYTDTTAETGITYHYTVRAYATVNGNTTRSYYDTKGLSVTPKLKEPALPSALFKNYQTIQLTFDPVDGAQGYGIYRRDENNSWKFLDTTASDTTTYRDETCVTGRTYYYSIRAYRMVRGSKVWSTYHKTGKSAFTRPTKPMLTAVSSYNYTTLKLTWTPTGNGQGYHIYRKAEGEDWIIIDTITDSQADTYKDSTATPGITYSYSIGSYINVDNKTVNSLYDSQGLTGKAVPSVPLLLGVQYTDSTTAAISWKSVAGASGYRVWKKAQGGSWKYIRTINGGNITTYSDTTATPGTTYYYSVSAYHTENNQQIWGLRNSSGRWVRGYQGIDISKWQSYINWKKVSYSKEFAIIRAAYGTTPDSYLVQNLENSKASGVKRGVYVYSTATTTTKAVAEAKNVIKLLEGYDLELPIFCDFEDPPRNKSSLKSANTNIIQAFCNELLNAGYETGVYSGANFFRNATEYSKLTDYNIWVANYHSNNSDFTTSYHTWSGGTQFYDFGSVYMWQYTSKGKVDGINGNVDLNIWYTCQ